MVKLTITDRNTIRSSIVAAHLLREIYARHPKQFKWQVGQGIEELSGTKQLRATVENGRMDSLFDRWEKESAAFLQSAAKIRLYQ